MIKVKKTKLKGVLQIIPDTFFDSRGKFVETYNKKLYKKHGIEADFMQDDISRSKKNVLRGIHGDKETSKLVSCVYGRLFFVVVNCNKKSRDFGKWQSFELSDENSVQVFVPPNYGIAYLVLSKEAIFTYKQSTYFIHGKQFTYRWDDPKFKIKWSIKNPILSKRDKLGHYA
ncbi:MAG: dTDP-4-dehydrorhamnose 3,5-epimerase family protein [Candidatus Staskawiczbacteria bacterium]|nr:dTDP-4-dehydrorhamnose 3,5-epimerase family protein [Candidatus Staskawiczbacteria bacterium]